MNRVIPPDPSGKKNQSDSFIIKILKKFGVLKSEIPSESAKAEFTDLRNIPTAELLQNTEVQQVDGEGVVPGNDILTIIGHLNEQLIATNATIPSTDNIPEALAKVIKEKTDQHISMCQKS